MPRKSKTPKYKDAATITLGHNPRQDACGHTAQRRVPLLPCGCVPIEPVPCPRCTRALDYIVCVQLQMLKPRRPCAHG